MTTRARIIAAALALPLAGATVIGPLGGAASADPPTITENTFAVVPGSVLGYPITSVVNDRGVETVTFTERYIDAGDFPGTSVTTWTCVVPADRQNFRCTGEGTFTGTFNGVSGLSMSTLRATCSDSGTAPVIVSCTGRFTLDGQDALDGLRSHGTFSSSGVFGATVRGSSESKVHFHR